MAATRARHLVSCVAMVGLLALFSVGCSSGKTEVKLVEVKGTVTLNGKPLADADVQFSPKGSGAGGPSFGTTDKDGHFVLKYSDGRPGAVPGPHMVTISWGGVSKQQALEQGPDSMKAPGKITPPKEYTQEVEVKEAGGNDFKFEVGGNQ